MYENQKSVLRIPKKKLDTDNANECGILHDTTSLDENVDKDNEKDTV